MIKSLEKTESKSEDSICSSKDQKTCNNSMEVSPESISQDSYWLQGYADYLNAESETGFDLAAAAYDEFLKQWYWAIDEKGNLIEPDSDEERECTRQWAESEGFDVTLSCGIMDSFIPYLNLDHVTDRERQSAQDFGKLAINYYNEKENENMEFVRLLKVNIQCGQGYKYYITFEAKDKDDGRADKFQSKVWLGPADEQQLVFTPEVLMCRKKACLR